MQLNRRNFGAVAGSAVASLVLGSSACRRLAGSVLGFDGRITARPRPDVKTSLSGQLNLGLDSHRDAVLKLPGNATASSLPLLVMLHGATQDAEDMFGYLGSIPDEAGVAVLAPHSRDYSWDAIGGNFGVDVEFLNRALERVFDKVAVDPARLAIGGFSDGATYALSLGLINGDLFSRVVAFSPGFVIKGTQHGKPRFFISHGTRDHILPVERCGRRIAAEFKAFGYDVTFREFDGDHEIPADIAREGILYVATA